ncbi:predicted protein, partial [Micromonas commoda]
EGAAKETGLPHGYHSGMRILLVGEGNLSFALALTTLFDGDGSNLLVTSFDRQRIARAAYPYCEDVEESLTESGAAVVFDVDVEEPDALRGGFDRIVFNFPDAGANQDMLGAFFDSAKGLLRRNGEVHVATQRGQGIEVASAWNVTGVAARHGLVYRASLDFEPGAFPGYEHYR